MAYDDSILKFGIKPYKKSIISPYTEHSGKNTRREKAAFLAFARNSDLYRMRKTIRQIEDRFNKNYNYPYVFLSNSPFSYEFIKGIQAMTESEVQFGLVEGEAWGRPSWIDKEKAETEKRESKYMNGKIEEYRWQCRAHSGHIFNHPLLDGKEYYWRIESGSKYSCDIDYDPFKFMKANGIVYGFNMAPIEDLRTVRTLLNSTKDFILNNKDMIPKSNLLDFVLDEQGLYNGCHFWSNFEIVKLEFFRSPEYTAYFKHLDLAGGMFYERWCDGPIHTMATSIFLNKTQVHYFEDIGYYFPALGNCPSRPDTKTKCICDPKKSFGNRHKCILHWKTL
ncbi:Glycolipid 2-alpha-mannosyltransferase 1 [Smittium mucronatum]|uniref:Glycolipid 2-alpha-mannosyltransferase 1 n=1 Tax=Smittium mucronatum TaxID=133383 RepID=A0A1R0H8T1_9FUNG|nr:Glycolipid 2-alpha-mannosyltransferase 1 [Smittium mucronatum]